jgi:CIC family chloride channel protein
MTEFEGDRSLQRTPPCSLGWLCYNGNGFGKESITRSQSEPMEDQQQASRHRNRLLQSLTQRFSHWLDRFQPPEAAVLMATSLLVGLGTGAAAIVFTWMIGVMTNFFFGWLPNRLPFLGNWALVIIPMLGGLVVGPIVYFFAQEAKGHGVPEVMEAVALKGGRIRPIVAVIKSIASAITIGSGGSAGREGPIVQIGSALGSTIGQVLKLSDERIRSLVACGAAGGIAATFNAPIAGVMFALEVILGEFSARYFATVVVAAVTSSVIARVAFGNAPAFTVPRYELVSPWGLLFHTVLGILAALVAIAFTRVLYGVEDIFDAWKRFPEYLKAAIGGLLLGIMGLLFYQANLQRGWSVPGEPVAFFGGGYTAMEWALSGQGAAWLVFLLAGLKIVATSLTIGSGGSGGIFAPSLFLGAMFGAGFGQVVHGLFPSITASAGAFAVVGMAAVFAGAARAPITAVLIIFEMTDDYHLILPLMLATVISTIMAEHLSKESIYTLKLSRRGIRLERGRDIDVMQGVRVGEVMTTDVDTVAADVDLQELEQIFTETHHHGFPVLEENGDLVGIVTLQDLERARERGPLVGHTVRDIASQAVLTIFPDEPMWLALKRLGTRDVGRLPVVDRRNPRRLMGLIRRNDIVRAYQVGISRRLDLQERVDKLRLGKLTGTEYIEIAVEPGSPQVGKRVRDMQFPEDCLLTTARRGNKVILLHGETRIQAGDQIVALVGPDCAEEVRKMFRGVGASSAAETTKLSPDGG